MITLNWKPKTETPATDEPITALLAYRYDKEWMIGGVYIWRAAIGWRHERMSTPPPTVDFAWLTENEILATIETTNGVA
jgi:hypothetical protein